MARQKWIVGLQDCVVVEHVERFGIRMKRRKDKRKMYEREQALFKKLQRRLTEFPGGKRDRVMGLDAYSFASSKRKVSPLDFSVSSTKKLSEIVERTRKYLIDAANEMDVFDALQNMDVEIKTFRDEYYPKLGPVERLDYEEAIREAYKVLESYAKNKIRRLSRRGMDKIWSFK